MAKCLHCNKRFNVKDAREDFNSYYRGGMDYDDQYPENDICAKCAIEETDSNISAGNEAVGPFGWDH